MMQKKMYGVVIPTITPMHKDGSIDEQSLRRYTKFLTGTGVHCLYPNGTNGESLMLKEHERQQIAAVMAEENNHQLPLFIQCGSMTTAETLSHIMHAKKIGADGAGIMTPAFFPMDEEAMFLYYSAASAAAGADFPLYVYNIPGCTTNDVSPRLLGRLLDAFANIKGIKFSCPNLMRVEDYLRCAARTPDLLIGCDSLFLQCLITGGVGTVTGPGAVFHKKFCRVYDCFVHGDLKGAALAQRQIVEIDRTLAGIPGIPALKAMLKILGIIADDTCRSPLRPLTGGEYETIKRVMDAYDKEENSHA